MPAFPYSVRFKSSFGRELFLFGLKVIKEPQAKGAFYHGPLIMVYNPSVKQLLIAACPPRFPFCVQLITGKDLFFDS